MLQYIFLISARIGVARILWNLIYVPSYISQAIAIWHISACYYCRGLDGATMLQVTSDAMIFLSSRRVILRLPSWPTKVIAMLFTELDAMDCPAHAYLLPLSNYLAERSPWQPTSHAMNHASPHHRRRMRLYLMGKHICAPFRMRISSKSQLSFSKCIALTIFVFGTEVNCIFSNN